MLPSAHATPEILAAYAGGALSDGLTLLVASHLTYCPGCRKMVERLEAIGGALLAEGDGVPPPRLEAALARLEAADRATDRATDPPLPDDGTAALLPGPMRRRLAERGGRIRWRFRLPGVAEYRLEGFEGETVGLMRARPGVRIPALTHEGEEATLVLCGQMRDADRVLRCGDLALADRHDDHRPEIAGDETCICLTVLSGALRFTGTFGRALNLLN